MRAALNLLLAALFATSIMGCKNMQSRTQGNEVENTPLAENTERDTLYNGVFTHYDFDKINRVKEQINGGHEEYAPVFEKLKKDVDKALAEGPFTVMQKTLTAPSGDKHDYLSLAPYWWPDPDKEDGLPWIRKDGEVNPMTKGANVDDPSKDRMLRNVKLLSWAYFFSEEQKYADKLIEILSTWFLNPETRMNPNLNYAQGVPGDSTGRGFGIIEFTGISHVVTALEILESGGALEQEAANGMREWLAEYLDWLRTSELGLFEQSRRNNHGTLYDVQVVGLLLFLNRKDTARNILEAAKTSRIAAHIKTDGTQPEELKRTKSLSYSILNLSGLTQLAFLGKKVNVDLWDYSPSEAGGILEAYDFLFPYAVKEKRWERQQLGNLESQIDRLQQLFVKTGSMFDVRDYCGMQIKSSPNLGMEQLLYPCMN